MPGQPPRLRRVWKGCILTEARKREVRASDSCRPSRSTRAMTGTSTQTPFAFGKFLRAGSLHDLLDAREATALRLCQGHGAWGGPTYLWSDNLCQTYLDQDDDSLPLPAIDLIALPDVELR